MSLVVRKPGRVIAVIGRHRTVVILETFAAYAAVALADAPLASRAPTPASVRRWSPT
ncbi:hypothetical protein OOJ91_07330 [Micromonospora lupini]|uniref:hypothetical protein n=1 Tax=Micromonospora lupini TaxID=285679 RepID=UPI002256C12F|nr:hypothetical protein [Micromonospora lupini]MCX5065690.1 hypothetical protein [Micromonospora lupini]